MPFSGPPPPSDRGVVNLNSNLSTLTKDFLIALALLNTKAERLQVSMMNLLRSTFDLISPVMSTFMATQI